MASRLAEAGYFAPAYSARGFGESTGTISIDAPDYGIADASELIDVLAERDGVMQDSSGDPRVAIFGRSYGGALTLPVGRYDNRVDAIAPGSTWSSLVSSLLPNDVGVPPGRNTCRQARPRR